MTEEKEEKNNGIKNLDPIILPTLTDLDLSASNFPEPRFIVPGLIPEGLTILAGKPKTGKSLLAYGLCYSLATGQPALGAIPVDQCQTLYLALEDQESRLKSKLSKIRGNNPPTNRMHFRCQWPRIDEGGLECLAEWIQIHPSVRFIVIDTFGRFRSLKSNGALYNKDYIEVSKIKKLADQSSIAILLIHHLRKASAVDELDLVTGSVGLTAAADSVAIFSRNRMASEATLLVSGRDIEECNHALSFDKSTLSWTRLGQAEEYHMSKERQEIIKVLESANGPLKLKDICAAVGKKGPVVHKLLNALIEVGFAEQPSYGVYQLVKAGETGESGKSSKSVDDGESGNAEPEAQDWIRDFDIPNNCNFNQVPV